MRRLMFFIVSALLPCVLQAQHFAFKAEVQAPDSTAFYRIDIHSGIVARSGSGLQDLRILDGDGKEVPYLLKRETTAEPVSSFESYPFTITRSGKESVLIVENRKRQSIRQLLFEMKNAEASRLIRISGSDNNADWFVVRDSFYFEPYAEENTATIQKVLTFPETDYAFYKIEIEEGQKEAPLNIIRVGQNATTAAAVLFQPVPDLSCRIVDSAKATYIFCRLKNANKIDRLTFHIDGPAFYKRAVRISRPAVEDHTHSKVIEVYDAPSMNAELVSDVSNSFDCTVLLGDDKYDAFTIEVQNGDDAPLHIRSVEAVQLRTTLVGRLEQGKSYALYFGDSLLSAPSYDIVFFEQNIPAAVSSLSAGPVMPLAQETATADSGNKDKWIVWAGIGIAGIIILLLTLNMMKKMKEA